MQSLCLAVTHLSSRLVPGCPALGAGVGGVGGQLCPLSGREAAGRPEATQLGLIQAQPSMEPRSLSSAGQLHLPHTFSTRNVLLASLESNFTRTRPS